MVHDSRRVRSCSIPSPTLDLLRLSGIPEITYDDIFQDRLIMTLKHIDVDYIGRHDAALHREILSTIARRVDTDVRFYFSENGPLVFCSLSGNFFQVLRHDLVPPGESAEECPELPEHVQLVFKPNIPPGMQVVALDNLDLREIAHVHPSDFRYPVEASVTSQNLFRFMIRFPTSALAFDRGPFFLYLKLQHRLLADYINAWCKQHDYTEEVLEADESAYNSMISSYIRYGEGYRFLNDFLMCEDETRSWPSDIKVCSPVLLSSEGYMELLERFRNAMLSEGHVARDSLPMDSTTLHTMSALYALSHSDLGCFQDFTNLARRREIVVMLFHSADLRTAVVAGALKAARFAKLLSNPGLLMDYGVLDSYFPYTAFNAPGLLDITRVMSRIYHDKSVPDIVLDRRILRWMHTIPGMSEILDAVMNVALEGNDRTQQLDDTFHWIMNNAPDIGFIAMAKAIAYVRDGNESVLEVYTWIVQHNVGLMDMDKEERLAVLKDTIDELDELDLRELVSFVFAHEIRNLLGNNVQCSEKAINSDKVLQLCDNAIMRLCTEQEGIVQSGFFTSFAVETIYSYYTCNAEYGLRMQDSPHIESEIYSAPPPLPDSGMER
ncbi:MAG: hypothetical protein ACTJLK_04010 [Anaplasma sp.]